MNVAGKTFLIEGKLVRCPSAPLYFIKASGQVIDITNNHGDADSAYRRVISSDRELWVLDVKGAWKLLRRHSFGKTPS